MTPPLVVCGDFGNPGCGVGSSERAYIAESGLDCPVLDPTSRWRDIRRALADARQTHRPALIVFPTISTAKSARAYLTFAWTALMMRRIGVKWHLHEYRIYREIRWVLDILMALSGTRTVVVSTRSEAAAMRRRAHVIPPANTTARVRPSGGSPEPDLVGIFGFFRPEDRNVAWMSRLLLALPARFTRLELIGTDWDQAEWPLEVVERYEVKVAGHVPGDELDARIEAWSLSINSYATGATDGKMSLRTPLAHGVPTITYVLEPADLTLDVPHLLPVGQDAKIDDGDLTRALSVDRAEAVAAVDRLEHECRDRLTAVLLNGSANG